MRERLASTASSTAKTIRTILADAAAMHHERPSRPELTCGVCTRGASVPIGVAALVCLIFDWKFAITIGRDWSNTFLVIAVRAIARQTTKTERMASANARTQLIFSFTLNLFLFVNMLMQLVEHPLAIKTRRHLSCVDMAIVILLIVGIAERIRGTRWGSRPIYYEPTRSGVQMLLVVFSLILSSVGTKNSV